MELFELQKNIKSELSALEEEKRYYPDYTTDELRDLRIRHSSGEWRDKIEAEIKLSSRIEELRLTLSIIKRRLRAANIYTESGLLTEMYEGGIDEKTIEVHGNLLDVGGNATVEFSAGSSDDTSQGQKGMLSLSDFFKRPVQIHSDTMTVGTYHEDILRPWDLYTLSPPVRAKLRNYAYLRGDLHVRVVISATQFHYGRVLVSYQPLDKANANLRSYVTLAGVNTDSRFGLLGYLSQAPGAFTIDVKDNTPIDICLPYIFPKPAYRLFNYSAAALGAASSYDDLYDAGALYIYTISPVQSVSAVDTTVGLEVYAWMENVELGVTTATQVAITTESGKLDEVSKGPFEKFFSGVSKIASMLKKAPVIGRFALPTEQFFAGLGSFAAIFGWSRPAIEQSMTLMKNTGYTNGATTISHDAVFKMTLDPKQQLCVDPRLCGSDEDEMTISHICARESYLTTFVWNTSDTNLGSPIFKCAVNPYLVTKWTHGLYTYNQPTALAFAAMPFQYWRGDITFRFDVVCSAFHRGKLAVFYEPNIYQSALINASLSTTKQYMKIIDLQEAQSVSFCVKWTGERTWLILDANNTTVSYGTLPTTTLDHYNGYIGITPLTKLTSPEDVPVNILVYVSSDNMQFNYATQLNFPNLRLIYTSSGKLDNRTVTCLELNASTADDSMTVMDHFGERAVSFRQLLKRYQQDRAGSATVQNSTTGNVSATLNNYRAPTPAYSTSTTASTMQNLFDYLRYAYMGIRGGIRYRFMVQGGVYSTDPYVQCLVKMSDNSDETSADSYTSATTSLQTSLRGSHRFTVNNNAGVEYEIPFFSNNSYVLSFCSDLVGDGNLGTDTMEKNWVRQHQVFQSTNSTTTPSVRMQFDVASAEDFMLLRFQGAPYFTYLT